jgi:hypothetical protein
MPETNDARTQLGQGLNDLILFLLSMIILLSFPASYSTRGVWSLLLGFSVGFGTAGAAVVLIAYLGYEQGTPLIDGAKQRLKPALDEVAESYHSVRVSRGRIVADAWLLVKVLIEAPHLAARYLVRSSIDRDL